MTPFYRTIDSKIKHLGMFRISKRTQWMDKPIKDYYKKYTETELKLRKM